MTIKITCPNCSSDFNVKEIYIWKEWKCPKCSHLIKINKNNNDKKHNRIWFAILLALAIAAFFIKWISPWFFLLSWWSLFLFIYDIYKRKNISRSDIITIIILIIVSIYLVTSYNNNQKLIKFIEIKNKSYLFIEDLFIDFAVSWYEYDNKIYKWWEINTIELSDDKYKRIDNSIDEMIKKWCPIINNYKEKCIDIYTELSEIIWLIYNWESIWLWDKVNNFANKYNEYNNLLLNDKSLKIRKRYIY